MKPNKDWMGTFSTDIKKIDRLQDDAIKSMNKNKPSKPKRNRRGRLKIQK
jgi:hypothetical protein